MFLSLRDKYCHLLHSKENRKRSISKETKITLILWHHSSLCLTSLYFDITLFETPKDLLITVCMSSQNTLNLVNEYNRINDKRVEQWKNWPMISSEKETNAVVYCDQGRHSMGLFWQKTKWHLLLLKWGLNNILIWFSSQTCVMWDVSGSSRKHFVMV